MTTDLSIECPSCKEAVLIDDLPITVTLTVRPDGGKSLQFAAMSFVDHYCPGDVIPEQPVMGL